MSVTPTVFWAVVATIAVVPYTPQRRNALRSAWMPAPAPESLVAMLITRFTFPPGSPAGTRSSSPHPPRPLLGARRFRPSHARQDLRRCRAHAYAPLSASSGQAWTEGEGAKAYLCL